MQVVPLPLPHPYPHHSLSFSLSRSEGVPYPLPVCHSLPLPLPLQSEAPLARGGPEDPLLPSGGSRQWCHVRVGLRGLVARRRDGQQRCGGRQPGGVQAGASLLPGEQAAAEPLPRHLSRRKPHGGEGCGRALCQVSESPALEKF